MKDGEGVTLGARHQGFHGFCVGFHLSALHHLRPGGPMAASQAAAIAER
jgi:hypothetical protein